jgi:4-amino-4-deoxy-L-arabinose transferase-like glycosyltransferase
MNSTELPTSTSYPAAYSRSSATTIAIGCLRVLAAAAVLLLLYRIVLMWTLPLADTTEARYGEIARLTVTNGFWLMPHIDVNTPFFAKPPLSTWVAASSMALFGINEFAARLPSLLAAFGTAIVTMAFASALQVKRRWLVLPVLATCPLFFISAGAVMTDAVQMFIVTVALYFAWRTLSIEEQGDGSKRLRRRWQIAFWTMVGIGALSKGLADWALIGLPLICYGLLDGRPVQMFKRLFSWTGALIAACIFVPWYAAAEHFYPGFLNYFIVGEHFSRFLVPGWKGDRYGIAHVQPLGTIWIFWVAAMLPWTGVFAAEFYRFARRARTAPSLERFLWCATLTPLIFFTFAHNIIWTYGLTAVVPFAVLVARWLETASERMFRFTSYSLLALSFATVALAPTISRNVNGNSDRDLVAAFHRSATPGTSMVYLVKPNYSPSFYAPGQVQYQPDVQPSTLASIKSKPRFVVLANKDLSALKGPWHAIFEGTRHTLIEEK